LYRVDVVSLDKLNIWKKSLKIITLFYSAFIIKKTIKMKNEFNKTIPTSNKVMPTSSSTSN